jgi:hypothetical protein
MIFVKPLISLTDRETASVQEFLDRRQDRLLPYHTLEFGRVIDEVFRYENLSLAAFLPDGDAVGWIPQWSRNGVLESVPWRDKGGPGYEEEEVLLRLIDETKRIVRARGLKGFCWRNFKTDSLESYRHLINVTVDLSKHTPETFPKAVNFKVRGKVKNALSNGLIWTIETDDLPNALRSFYRLFTIRRKQLGVPVYPFRLFEFYFRHMHPHRIKLFSVYKDDRVVASLILLHNRHTAIDAYSASDEQGVKLKANDLMIHEVIRYCIRQKLELFDFGADSPYQESLIQYKMKWLGAKHPVEVAYFGKISERDHNNPRYDLVKNIVRCMPVPLYELFSRMIVR